MTSREGAEQIRQLAGTIGLLRPTDRAQQALVGHFLGVLHALIEAFKLGFVDRTGPAAPREYSNELSRIARCLVRGSVPNDRQWVAGFCFNSALYRLASLAERVGKHAGQDRRLAKDVSEEANRLKHDVEGLLSGRQIRPLRLVAASKKVGRALARVVPSGTA